MRRILLVLAMVAIYFIAAGATVTAQTFPTSQPAASQPIEDIRKAAKNGAADAELELGLRYANGLGVPRDYGQAMQWFQKSAEQGNLKAELEIGVGYLNGIGVPKDEAEGVRWIRKGADQGYAPAQRDLGGMYRNGDGVPKHLKKVATRKFVIHLDHAPDQRCSTADAPAG